MIDAALGRAGALAPLVIAMLAGCELVAGLDDKTLAPEGSGGGATTATTTAGGGGSGGSETLVCPTPKLPDSTPYCTNGDFEVECDDPTAPAGQDGQIVLLPPSYAVVPPDWVLDQVTGIEWQRIADVGVAPVGGPEACNIEPVTMEQGEVPDLLTLLTIMDYGREAPTSDPNAFTRTGLFFASTTYSTDQVVAFDTKFGALTLIAADMKADLRCARGALTGAFIEHDTVVEDTATGLLWQKTVIPGDHLTWGSALAACANAPPTNCGPWRLPSIKELVSLMRGSDGTLPPNAFQGQPTGLYWSSTPVSGDASQVWLADYLVGATLTQPIGLEAPNEVRCVR